MEQLFFNGLDGDKGGYLLPPLSPSSFLGRMAHQSSAPALQTAGVMSDVCPTQLAEAGWGVLWAGEPDPEIAQALEPLLALRRRQSEAEGDGRFWSLIHRGESADELLESHGASLLGPVDPKRFPYYVLIVGPPHEIPFELQTRLAESHLVGRLCFDRVEDYRHYACNVVAAEREEVTRPRRAVLFGVRNWDDAPTTASLLHLVRPLRSRLQHVSRWRRRDLLMERATKKQLLRLLGGRETPALLFTVSHSICFGAESESLEAQQGGLVCFDWPGPELWPGPCSPEQFVGAEDIPDAADLRGLICFHFSCFSAGTPDRDSFPEPEDSAGSPARVLAPRPFVAALPKRLLGHRRGALAVIGHVDRAWQHSFVWRQVGGQIEAFESILRGLMAGQPVGLALAAFAERQQVIASRIAQAWIEEHRGQPLSPEEKAELWISYQDARGYVLLGDPAVRLPLR